MQLDHNQFIAVDTFAKGLRGCLEKKIEQHTDELFKIGLGYAINILNLHLELAELDFDLYDREIKKRLDK